MCGRYSITVNKSTLERRFNARFATAQQEFEPRYNAAPSQLLPIITTYAPNDIVLARWGFVPEGWHNPKIRPQNNARVETAAEKPRFRSSYTGQHCLVLTDGFYEWKTIGTRKQPYQPITAAAIAHQAKLASLPSTARTRNITAAVSATNDRFRLKPYSFRKSSKRATTSFERLAIGNAC
jgi:putative SOS response-associated peptidase YedK